MSDQFVEDLEPTSDISDDEYVFADDKEGTDTDEKYGNFEDLIVKFCVFITTYLIPMK